MHFYGHNNLSVAHFWARPAAGCISDWRSNSHRSTVYPGQPQPFPNSAKGNSAHLLPGWGASHGKAPLESLDHNSVAHTDNHPSRIHLISATSSLPHPALPLTSSPPYATFHHQPPPRDFCVLQTARWANQSILKEVNPKYSLEGLMLMLKLKLQDLWPPDVKSQLIEKDPDIGKDWRQKEKRAGEDEMVK